MMGKDDDSDALVIRIPASMISKQVESTEEKAKTPTNEYNFFKRTGIIKIKKTLITEHGKTEVQSLGFNTIDQRQKVLDLLDNPVLYSKLPELFQCIYDLGCQKDGEKRYYAAIAVSQLAKIQPFLYLKDELILPWAKSNNSLIQNCAAVALADMLENKRNESEVLLLLRHWITNSSVMLVNTALSTYFRMARSHTAEVLEAIRITLEKGSFFQCLAALDIFGYVYEASPEEAIEQLYSWIIPISDTKLCKMAAPLFLLFIRLDNAIESEKIREKVIDMIVTLWDTPATFMYSELQGNTTLKMHQWATEVLALWDKESRPVLERYLTLFRELNLRYVGKRRNRLQYHLERWERNRVRELQRNKRRSSHDTFTNEEVSYNFLIN